MSDIEKSLKSLSEEERRKVKELMEKDAKSERKLRGPWLWVSSILSAIMVLIYFYGAGYQALGTQYHLGVYVLITFVLIFILYPAGGRFAVGCMSLSSAVLLSAAFSSFYVFESPQAFYMQMSMFMETWGYDGFKVAFAQDFGALRTTVLLMIPLAVVLFPVDQWFSKRYHHAPTPSDIIMALVIGGAVIYWISQFEALNYRAGAENELDKLISVIGLMLSMEICRRVLGWSITLIGVGMICFAIFGPYLPELFAHRGFAVSYTHLTLPTKRIV